MSLRKKSATITATFQLHVLLYCIYVYVIFFNALFSFILCRMIFVFHLNKKILWIKHYTSDELLILFYLQQPYAELFYSSERFQIIVKFIATTLNLNFVYAHIFCILKVYQISKLILIYFLLHTAYTRTLRCVYFWKIKLIL